MSISPIVPSSPLLGSLGFSFDAPLLPAIKAYCEGEETTPGQAEITIDSTSSSTARSTTPSPSSSGTSAHLNTVLLHVQRKKRLDDLLQHMGPYLTNTEPKVRPVVAAVVVVYSGGTGSCSSSTTTVGVIDSTSSSSNKEMMMTRMIVMNRSGEVEIGFATTAVVIGKMM